MIYGKPALALLSFLICALALSGCIESKQSIIVDEDGMASISFSAIADKSQAGEELVQFAWEAEQLMPQLNSEYQRSNYTFEDGSTEYMVYEWTAKKRIPVTDVKGVSWNADNLSYNFALNMAPLFSPEDVAESDRNEVVMEINLTMPGEISSANTPFVRGSTARWVITKELLTQGNVLRASANRSG